MLFKALILDGYFQREVYQLCLFDNLNSNSRNCIAKRKRANIFRDYNLHIVKRIDNNFISIIHLRRRGTIIHTLLISDSSQ